MTRKTDGEKIDDLEKLVARIQTEMETGRRAADQLYSEHRETRQQLADLHREFVRDVSLLKRESNDLRQWRDQFGGTELKSTLAVLKEQVSELKGKSDESSKRRWSILPPLVGGIIGSLLTLTSNLLINYLRK